MWAQSGDPQLADIAASLVEKPASELEELA